MKRIPRKRGIEKQRLSLALEKSEFLDVPEGFTRIALHAVKTIEPFAGFAKAPLPGVSDRQEGPIARPSTSFATAIPSFI